MAEGSEKIEIPGISERDVDLLLLEEFHASTQFCKYFLTELDMNAESYAFLTAARSITHSTGESDLEVVFEKIDGSRYALMLENKVNAGFQRNQAIRYQRRGQNYRTQGKIADFATVLLAPKIYFSGDRKGFDFRIDYETIRDFFAASDLTVGRKNYKIAVLSAAIEKSSIGYQMVADAAVTQFWRAYWQLTRETARELGMEEPSGKPAKSGFVYFGQAGLPIGVDLVHKLGHGYFDLQFSGMGNRLVEMDQRYGDKLAEGMKIEKAAKSASIRIVVPKLSVAEPLDEQRQAVLKALDAGKALLEWARVNLPPKM